jgi:hypothetical protein
VNPALLVNVAEALGELGEEGEQQGLGQGRLGGQQREQGVRQPGQQQQPELRGLQVVHQRDYARVLQGLQGSALGLEHLVGLFAAFEDRFHYDLGVTRAVYFGVGALSETALDHYLCLILARYCLPSQVHLLIYEQQSTIRQGGHPLTSYLSGQKKRICVSFLAACY